MKARVKATGEIVEVIFNSPYYDTIDGKERYYHYELDFQDIFDYWERLEHTYAGMAMQGMLNNSLLITSLLKVNKSHEDIVDEVTSTAFRYAHALVQKLKEKEERK